MPASDRRPDSLYLDEVKQSDLYVGLFGNDYGNEDDDGVSPTEREFNQATDSGIHRLIFVKGKDNNSRHPKMQALIHKAQAGLVRKRFNTLDELVTAFYTALVEYLDTVYVAVEFANSIGVSLWIFNISVRQLHTYYDRYYLSLVQPNAVGVFGIDWKRILLL